MELFVCKDIQKTLYLNLRTDDMELIFATSNPGKLREASEILALFPHLNCTVLSPAALGLDFDPEETGSTLNDNSLLKARELWKLCSRDCFADDTGLEVDALGGAPGVHTARYAEIILAGRAASHDSGANMDCLLSELDRECKALGAKGEPTSRRARFRTVVTLVLKGNIYQFNGCLEGSIAFEKAGCGGFGYDPIFIPDGFGGKTLSEISESEKNSISHRGKALREMASFLSARACSQI